MWSFLPDEATPFVVAAVRLPGSDAFSDGQAGRAAPGQEAVGRQLLSRAHPGEPGAGSSGFRVADELVFQSVPGSVRGSPNRGITLAPKPVTAVMRSPAVVTTSSP